MGLINQRWEGFQAVIILGPWSWSWTDKGNVGKKIMSLGGQGTMLKAQTTTGWFGVSVVVADCIGQGLVMFGRFVRGTCVGESEGSNSIYVLHTHTCLDCIKAGSAWP